MLSEDEALLKLDQELDCRMRNLCGKPLLCTTEPRKKNGSGILRENLSDSLQDSPHDNNHIRSNYAQDTSCSHSTQDLKLNKPIIKNAKNSDCETTESTSNATNDITSERISRVESIGTVCQTESREENSDKSKSAMNDGESAELEEAQDAVFDEFLEQSTQIRIKSLTKRISHLTEALNAMRGECRKLAQAKQEALSSAHSAEVSRRNISKQLQSVQQESAKHLKSNKQLQERVKELTSECQMLRKELSSTQQSQCEHKNAQVSSRAQLSKSRADNSLLKEQIADLKKRHKEELEDLRSTVSKNDVQIKDLERQQRNYCALVKKQELLIRVLNEQKINIGVAKATSCLEEKFLSLLTPLQPP